MKRKKLVAAISVLSLAILWFAGVDWSWFLHECPDCGRMQNVCQYRIFSFPIHEATYEYPTITQRVATDLGVPCRHENSKIWHKHRWWGLCICKSPCINGTYNLTSDDSWYTDAVSEAIAALAKNDPSLPSEFERRVLRRHEWKYAAIVLDQAGVDRNQDNAD